jgi:hypothetical protein
MPHRQEAIGKATSKENPMREEKFTIFFLSIHSKKNRKSFHLFMNFWWIVWQQLVHF